MYQLRCERCGYSLEGSPGPAVCPECGLAGAASEPKNRKGTPFQRRGRPDEVLPTVRLVLLEPGVAWSVVRPVWSESWRLGLWLLGLTSLCLGIGLVGLFAELPIASAHRRYGGLPLLVGAFAAVPAFAVLFLVARASEFVLESLWGLPRGRLDRAGSVTVVAHALSALLVTGVVVGSVGLANALMLERVAGAPVVAGLLFGAGLAWYAVLVRRGAAELRFANRLREWEGREEG